MFSLPRIATANGRCFASSRSMVPAAGAVVLLFLSFGRGTTAYATGQAASPVQEMLLHFPFTKDTGEWVSAGKNSKMTQATEDARQTLRWDYSVQKGDLSALMLPVSPGALARAKTVRFAIKCSSQTPVAVVLQEKNGGRYLAVFSTPADAWQTVELTPSDFLLAEGKDDPKDPDHRLDMDQIESIGLADLTQFVLQSDNAALITLFGVKSGDKHLFLGDFAVYGGGSPSPASYDVPGGRVDTFAHPQAGWIALNASSLNRVGASLRVTYHQSDTRPLVLGRGVPSPMLSGTKQLSLVLQSQKPAKILVQLETHSGNKWKTILDIAGQNTRKPWTLVFADFTPDDQNKPVDGKTENFDAAQVHQLTLLDISGITDGAIDDNTLILSGIVVK